MADFKLDSINPGGATGMDALFESNPSIVSPVGSKAAAATPKPRIRVASLKQLDGFHRVSEDTLVNKSTQDLWAIRKDGDSMYIERLFEDNGQPLKG